MQALVLNDETREALQELKDRAEKEPMTLSQILELLSAEEPPADLNMDKTVEVPVGYAVTYTNEEQPSGLFRHLSMSAGDANGRKPPSPEAFAAIAELFDLDLARDDLTLWLENGIAVNALQPVLAE